MRLSIEPEPPPSATGSRKDWRRTRFASSEERRPSTKANRAFAEEITTIRVNLPELQANRYGEDGS